MRQKLISFEWIYFFFARFLSVDFQASSSTPLEPPYWRWAVCGKPSVIPRKDKLGEHFLKKAYSLMEKTWCRSEFWFHLFPSSWFVTLGIHVWIRCTVSSWMTWEPTYKKLIRLGMNFQHWVTAHMVLFGSTVNSWKVHENPSSKHMSRCIPYWNWMDFKRLLWISMNFLQ